MTKEQSQKLAMYMAVLRILRNARPLLESAPALEALTAEFERLIAEIQHTVRRRKSFDRGSVLAKSIEREELMQRAFTVSAAIRAWATHTGDLPLAQRYRNAWSVFKRMRQVLLHTQVEAILESARALGNALEPFGVDMAFLDALEASNTRFRELLAQPRTAIVHQSTATVALAGLFREADDLLKERIDQLFHAIRGADLHRDYRGARRIAGARRSSRKPGPEPEGGPADIQARLPQAAG